MTGQEEAGLMKQNRTARPLKAARDILPINCACATTIRSAAPRVTYFIAVAQVRALNFRLGGRNSSDLTVLTLRSK